MRILSAKPNQSALCSGVKFEHQKSSGVWVSEEVNDAVGARFCSIDGYTKFSGKLSPADLAEREAEEEAALVAELAAEADVLKAAEATAPEAEVGEKKEGRSRSRR